MNFIKSITVLTGNIWDSLYKFMSGKGVVYQDITEYAYTGKHFLVLAFAIIGTIGIYFLFKKFTDSQRTKFLKITAFSLMILEILAIISKLLYFADLNKLDFGQAIQVILPIHFCSVIIWVLIFAMLFDNKPMMSFGAICGFFGCLVYLLYPAEGLGASFIHIRAVNSVVSHSVGFMICTNLMLHKMIKLEIGDMWKTFVLLSGMVAWAGLMNWLFPYDANGNLNNYMFMMKNPTPITTNVVPYQLVFALIAVIVFSSFYIIPYLITKHKLKKAQLHQTAEATKPNNE